MAAGKRVQNVWISTYTQPSLSPLTGFGHSFRNIPKAALGGVIFGCSKFTIAECLQKQLFGLPGPHIAYVKNIDPGLPLFLFNYSDKKLHGIFEAVCPGQMNIDPYGWSNNGSEKTQYPAQVQIHVKQQCQPMHEGQFKPIIADNYFNDRHFYFELDRVQTQRLLTLFQFSPLAPGASVFQFTAKVKAARYVPVRKNDEGTEKLKAAVQEDEQSEPQPSSTHDEKEGHRGYTLEASDVKHDNPVETHDRVASSSLISGRLLLEDRIVTEPKIVAEAEQGEESLVVEKLKQLSLKPGSKSSFLKPSYQMPGAANHHGSKEKNGTEIGDVNCSCDLPDCRSIITQFMQELEQVKTFGSEQALKMSQLEEKLGEAEKQIELLKDHCFKLESVPGDHSTKYEKTMQNAFEGLNLDLSDCIYIIGGHDGERCLSSLDLYFPFTGQTQSFDPMSHPRAYASVAESYGQICVMGGGDGNLWYDTVESYNPGDDCWNWLPSLSKKKGSLASATISDQVYAFGGGNGAESFADVEMLDFEINRWIPTLSMEHKRFSLAGTELNGALYATGGYDGNVYLNSCERFDPREHRWTRIADMNQIRASHCVVALNDKIYAMGGNDGVNWLSSTEVYDPRKGSWFIEEPMRGARGYAAAVVVKDAILLFGGVDDSANPNDTVEYFKEGQGWREQKMSGIGKRTFMSAVVSA
ncbi:Kelch-like protein 5 [Linum grandiflorum]